MNTKTLMKTGSIIVVILLSLGLNTCSRDHSTNSAQTQNTSSKSADDNAGKKILYWRAPMDPNYISDKPGKSPMGMDLVPVYEGEETTAGVIKIDPVVEQNMGVRTAPVEKRALFREIRAFGRVTYDQTKLTQINTKVTGYIEKSIVNTTGEQVEEGAALVDIYSPDLVATQEEYLQAFRNLQRVRQSGANSQLAQAQKLLVSSRQRLQFWDISDQQINRLGQTGNITKTMTLHSPFKGVVIEMNAIEGMRVQPGMTLYKIADLGTVWVESDVYEYELPWLKQGQPVQMNLSYIPGKEMNGRVNYIYPYLEPKTRTVKVRSVFENKNKLLKPGMYANVRIASTIGDQVVAIPEESVIFSGERTLVFLALGNGRFLSKDVKLGALSGDGFYQVLSGLNPGETVVTSGQFLLDSESKLKEAVQKMLEPNSSSSAGSMDMSGQDSSMSGNSGMQMDHSSINHSIDHEMSGSSDSAMEHDTMNHSANGTMNHNEMQMNQQSSTSNHNSMNMDHGDMSNQNHSE